MIMSEYVRLTKTVKDKGQLIKPEEIKSKIDNPEIDYYTSTYLYNKKQFEQFQSTGTVKGITDVISNKLWFDFDSKEDISKAKDDTLELLERLSKNGIDTDKIEIYFSGNKGFNVIINLDRNITPEQVRYICLEKIGKGLQTLDTTLYDSSQLLRVPGTKHQESGLFKIPITKAQLKLHYSTIKSKAKDLSNFSINFKWDKIKFNDKMFEIPIQENKKDIVKIDTFDLTTKPRYWKSYKWALVQGYFEKGERHEALMILAATCRGMGYDQKTAYYICKSALNASWERYGEGSTDKEELWNNIINTVYSDFWQGGQYTPKSNTLLKKICDRLGLKDEPIVASFKKVEEMEDVFKNYALNFEKNIVTTGISEIDNNVMFLCSTHNGILGQPGCHSKGTKILMYDGTSKNVEDIIIGDLLMGPDSTSREVLKLQRGIDKMYEITPIKGEKFIINQHHVLNLKPSIGTNNKAFECNLNIMLKDYIEKTSKVVKNRYKIHRTSVDFPTVENLEIDPYILGLWLGDGHSDNTSIINLDQEVIDEWISYGKSLGLRVREDSQNALGRSKVKSYNLVNNTPGPNILRDMLRKINVFNNKHIPQKYLSSNLKQRLALLAGLLDTDGSLDNNNTGFDFISKLEKLTDSVIFLARSLGLVAYKKETKKGCWYNGNYKEGTYYRCHISGNVDIIPTKVKRKQARLRKQVKDVQGTGFSYKDIGEGEYYGFTLDKDHLYLTSDFIVHHNSGKTSWTLQWLKYLSSIGSSGAFYSLDMGEPIIYAKLLQQELGISFKLALQSYKNNPELIKNLNLKEKYKNILFNFKSGLTIKDIRNDIKEHQEKTGIKLKLLVIDYLECLAGPYSDSIANTAFISQEMKDLANELEICSIMLLQTQKHSVSDVSDPLLSMKKIKGSSAIEQSSSVILTLWREGYNPNTVDKDKFISFAAVKNRFGPLWSDDFYWDGVKGLTRNIDDIGREDLIMLKEEKLRLRAQRVQEERTQWE